MNYHKLLEKQIEKLLPTHLKTNKELLSFLNTISATYQSLEKERILAERAFNIAEEDYQLLNNKLLVEAEVKRQSIEKLKEAIGNIEELETHSSSEDLLSIARYINKEIVERKSAQKIFSSLIKNMHSGVLLEDEARNVILSNQNYCDLFNIDTEPDILVGKNVVYYIEKSSKLFKHPHEYINHINLLIAEKKLVLGEIIETLDGRIFQRDYIPIFSDKTFKGSLWSYTDITSSKKAQLAIEQSEHKNRLIMNSSLDAIITTDKNGYVTFWNPQAEKIFGYSQSEIIGLPFLETHLANDTKYSISENIKNYNPDSLSDLFNKHIEITANKKNGTIFSIEMSIVPIQEKENHFFCFFIKDITAQNLNQKELKKLSLIIEQTINAVIVTDALGKIEWTNKAFEHVTGYSIEEVKGKKPGHFLQGENTDKDTILYMRNQIKKKEPFTCEIYNYKKSGEGYWLRINGQPIFDNNGDLINFFAIEEDITEKINIEKKLDNQRIFYEEILDNIPSDIAVLDSTQHYLYINPKGIENSEIRKWIIGKTNMEYVIHRNKPIEIATKRDALFNEVLKNKELVSWEEEINKADNSKEYILRHMFPVLDAQKNVKIVIGYGVDITNIKNIQQQIELSEKKYRDVIDNSLAIINTHDMEGIFLTINPIVQKIYGYTVEEMIGKSLIDYMPQSDKVLFDNEYLNKIKTEKKASGIFRIISKTGKIIYTLYNNFLKEEKGKEPYVISFAVDITDRIKAEKELRIAKKVTEELAQTKQNFLANMSHEIRTPMNAIMGMAAQLSKTKINKDQAFYLNTIQSASENLLIIINDILDLSKVEAGKLTLENIGFELKPVIERAMQVMQHKAEEKGLSFTNSLLDPKINHVLIGDPYRINQILLNLISNAIKFTDKGVIDIQCTVLEDDDEYQKIKLKVKDTGIGMETSFSKKLFQKFNQEDISVSRKYGGTGLGMSISKELVELMGGEIKVESTKHIGTEVMIIIKLKKGKAEDLPVKVDTKSDVSVLKGASILVADDNKMNRLLASTIFNNYGVHIDEAVDGTDAIEKIKSNNYDIVFMDVQMPEMDGLEATRIIRKTISTTLPIVALTAFAIKGDSDKCLDAGMNDFLSKPFEENDLISIACKWIEENKVINTKETKKIISNIPLYSLEKLHSIANGNKDFINEMIDIFIEQSEGYHAQMRKALASGDIDTIKAITHRIKPSISNMGIDVLKSNILNIEKNADALLKNNKLNEMFYEIEDVLESVIEDLKSNRK